MTEWTDELIRKFVSKFGYLPDLVRTEDLDFSFICNLLATDKLISKVIFDEEVGELLILFDQNPSMHVIHYVSKNTALVVDEKRVIGILVDFSNKKNIDII